MAFDFFSSVLQRFEDDDAARLFDFFGRTGGEIENGVSSLLRLVEALAAAGENSFDECGGGAMFFFKLGGEISDSEGVNNFERAEFPAEAPAHGAVDIGAVV